MPCVTAMERVEHSWGSGLLGFAEPGVKPNYAPSRSSRIEHIDVTIRMHPVEQWFTCRSVIRWRPLPGNPGELVLDLDDVDVESVTDADGTPLAYDYGDALTIRTDNPVVVIQTRLASPTRGMYFTGPETWAPERQHMAWTQCQDEDGHFIMPCHDHPQARHPWSIRLEAPAGFQLLSNGELTGSGEDDGWAWATYEQRGSMPAYLFTAVAGQLSVQRAEGSEVPVAYWVPVGSEEAVSRSMGKTPEMIRAFGDRLGVRYPWPRYDQVVVHDFIFGGMENTACTTMTDRLLVDEKAAVEWDPEVLVAHELAHQWFGDYVTCRDWSQGWLNESWATMMECIWYEASREPIHAIWHRWEAYSAYLGEYRGRYRRPIVSYSFREPIDMFDRHLYQKGSCVLQTLRTELGEEGFWAGVQTYLERCALGPVHTRDFQSALEDTTGRNLDQFMDTWIHRPGHPEVKVGLSWSQGLLSVDVTQTQTGDDIPEAYAFPLELELVDAEGNSQSITLGINERSRTWAVPSAEPKTVRVDPRFAILADIQLAAPFGWLVSLLDDPSPVLALRAANALLKQPSGRAFRAVVHAMDEHPWWGTRAAIARAIGGLKSERARDALLDASVIEWDPRVLKAIVSALGAFREVEVADRMLQILEDEPPTWHLQAAALSTLARTRDARALEALTQSLAVDSWGDIVRLSALAAIASLEDEQALPTLLEWSQLDRAPRVRGTAARALGQLASRVPDVRQAAVDRIVEMLNEPGFFSVLQAIQAATVAGDTRALGPLSRIHQSAGDGRTRRMAYEASVRIRRGRTSEEGLADLRAQVQALQEQNAKLTRRLDKLEPVENDS